MSENEKKPAPRKKPKISLLQIMFLIAAVGIILIAVHQHGGL